MNNVYEKYPHVMVDLETLGTSSRKVLTAIAAVHFDLKTGETFDSFHVNIDIQSCIDAGLEIDGNTLRWWVTQSEEARKRMFDPEPVSLSKALFDFTQWYEGNVGRSANIWGNSARFDLGILEDAYLALGKGTPWPFYMEKDVRTLVGFNMEIKENEEFAGTPHDPVADCYHQIKYCHKTYNAIQLKSCPSC
jgi:hypothetical protein